MDDITLESLINCFYVQKDREELLTENKKMATYVLSKVFLISSRVSTYRRPVWPSYDIRCCFSKYILKSAETYGRTFSSVLPKC